ncbi:MAG: hypothetical protein FJ202_07665 [Gemmatimonadetes bacterium]|nr:hypothetical protein [Gemmatimonadota bacterium]
MKRTFAVVSAGSLLINTACFSYLPPAGGAVAPATDVRIELTGDGSSTMAAMIGPRVRTVSGRVRAVDAAGTTILDVEQVATWDGVATAYLGRDAVRLPREVIARADVRTLDRRRSWVAAGAISAAFVVVAAAAFAKARSRASGNHGRIGGSPPDLRAIP